MINIRKCKGQGIANIASGFIGGMAGCAMIGQSMINVKSGGLTRLSTFSAGIFLLILVVFISDWLKSDSNGCVGCCDDYGLYQ